MKMLKQLRKLTEKGAAKLARGAWPLVQGLNSRVPSRPFQPAWGPGARPVGAERTAPPLGWPRRTDSLCPKCVKEVREQILAGTRPLDDLRRGNPAGIPATILERDGKVLMVKDCPKHGHFEDVLSTDPAFTARIEGLFPGRDYTSPQTSLRDHGPSSVKYGRGAVLTVDLTNRCNMMCEPCFTDANQVGFVHELQWEDIKRILDDSMTVQPRRQMTVQFSGGEPTLSPHFLRALSYARELGYISIQAATNGIRFATEPGFAKKAKEAGLRLAYLQFDGVGNEANQHRKISNLFDVKRRAIENLRQAGIDVVLVTTIVNTLNNDQVGPILDFAIENIDAVTTIAYQPVSFTGRDEDIADEQRRAQRYTLSHLANDMHRHTGYIEPMRDWFPLSALAPFADMTDTLLGGAEKVGSIHCGCHPSCGVGTILMVNKHTREVVPLSRFLDVQGLLADLQQIADVNRGKASTMAQLALALLRHYDPTKAPADFDLATLLRQYLSQTGAIGLGVDDADRFAWRVLFIGGMWFQDLYTYDFRRTEMCIVPYGTQLGEISFCAYNTGMGWRHYVEKNFASATTREWYKTHGRHAIYANHKPVPLDPAAPQAALTYEDLLAKGAEALAARQRPATAGGEPCGVCLGGAEPSPQRPHNTMK